MTAYNVVHWIHLIAACVWVGGLITLAALIGALRKAGVERDTLRAVARAYARVSWTAMAVAVASGITQVQWLALPWSYGRLHIKLGLVGLVVVIALVHQLTARKASPAVRGITQLVILIVSLAIVFAAAQL